MDVTVHLLLVHHDRDDFIGEQCSLSISMS
jgi:hypothetical protein